MLQPVTHLAGPAWCQNAVGHARIAAPLSFPADIIESHRNYERDTGRTVGMPMTWAINEGIICGD